MKENLILKLTRKQLEKVCLLNNLADKGSRESLEASIKVLSYKAIKNALNS